jgi:hypothetical protein
VNSAKVVVRSEFPPEDCNCYLLLGFAHCIYAYLKDCDRLVWGLVGIILPAALGPGDYSASNRNVYQKHKKNNNVSGE